jgi:hypothetical protein
MFCLFFADEWVRGQNIPRLFQEHTKGELKIELLWPLMNWQ